MEGQRKYFIGGNWKCNGLVETNKDLILETLNKSEFDSNRVDVVVAPIFIHIALAKATIKGGVQVAAQNVSQYEQGPYTGEVAATQLADFDIKWVIIGHSERRNVFGETDEIVAAKTKISLEKGLNVILCIGEHLEDREAEKTNEVLGA